MRITLILIMSFLLTHCSNSYVKNKKIISSPNDLMKFTNIWCEKNKSTDKIIRMCGQGWSKDLTISEQKAIMDSKLKIADITQHSLIKNEKIIHKDNKKGIDKSYEMTAENILEEATISGYKIISKKVLKEKNGWRSMVLLEYNLIKKRKECLI